MQNNPLHDANLKVILIKKQRANLTILMKQKNYVKI